MEIIEKQVEKVKEVPTDGYYGDGRRDVNGKANAGLTLGIIGTALGAWALFGNRRSSGLLGLAGFDSRSDRFSDRFNESGMRSGDMDRMMRYMRNSMNGSESEHFTESEAKYLVADMYHTENGRKYSGEKFDMHKAKEICERYRGILPTSATVADVYVAINSQYHDYAELFKNWFGDGIEQKIVESAIVFWFKDADCKAENKVVEYLGEY